MKKVFLLMISLLLLTGCATAKLKNGEESIVTFSEGGISAEDLYKVLKEKYGTEELITLIDTNLLNRKYTEDDAEKNYVKDVLASAKEQFGDSFLSSINSYYGVSSEEEFKEYIRLVYRRNKWQKDYAKSIVNDNEINDYYEQTIIGDIEASHILIQVNSEEEEADALLKAKEVITKLNNGEDFTALAKEYSGDAATASNGGELPAFNDRSNYDENFLEAAINLENGKYSSTPVKSKYGYHIIYKKSQKEKPELKAVKDEIVNKLAELKVSDSSFIRTAILALREEYKMNITDSYLSSGYNEIYGE